MVRDEKYYNDFRTDLQKMVSISYSQKESSNEASYRPEPKPDYQPFKAEYQPMMASVNLHENRDKLKGKFP